MLRVTKLQAEGNNDGEAVNCFELKHIADYAYAHARFPRCPLSRALLLSNPLAAGALVKCTLVVLGIVRLDSPYSLQQQIQMVRLLAIFALFMLTV